MVGTYATRVFLGGFLGWVGVFKVLWCSGFRMGAWVSELASFGFVGLI